MPVDGVAVSNLDPIYEDHARLIAARVADLLRERTCIVPEFISPEDASILTGISVRTLEKYRCREGDSEHQPFIPFIRVSRLVRYKVSDLRAFMDSRRSADAP